MSVSPGQSIHFHYLVSPFSFPGRTILKGFLARMIRTEGFRIAHINYIFCDDPFLLQLNQEFLQHNTYTDIITFDNSEDPEVIEGDIFISVERIRENASKFDIPFEEELRRVIIHGVLHLLGYSDKSSDDKIAMRGKEDAYLSLFQRST